MKLVGAHKLNWRELNGALVSWKGLAWQSVSLFLTDT